VEIREEDEHESLLLIVWSVGAAVLVLLGASWLVRARIVRPLHVLRAGAVLAGLGSVTAATEQRTASAAEIARQVQQTSDVTRAAGVHARAFDERMRALQETAERIGGVVRLINEIAGQSNLLALNATIEAARAGEAGKRFAVVAFEVKHLAAQTARATEDIAAQVDEVRQVTDEVAVAVHRMGETIGPIEAVADVIATSIDQQGAATRDIDIAFRQSPETLADVDHLIAAVSRRAA